MLKRLCITPTVFNYRSHVKFIYIIEKAQTIMLTSCLRRYSLQHHIMVLIILSVLIITFIYLFLYWKNVSFLTTVYTILGSSLAAILIAYRITQKLMSPLGALS